MKVSNLESIFRRSKLADPAQLNVYLNLMADIWVQISHQIEFILRDSLFDLDALLNGEGDFIWFSLSDERRYYELPFDFSLVPELPLKLVRLLYEKLLPEKPNLTAEQSHVLNEMSHQ